MSAASSRWNAAAPERRRPEQAQLLSPSVLPRASTPQLGASMFQQASAAVAAAQHFGGPLLQTGRRTKAMGPPEQLLSQKCAARGRETQQQHPCWQPVAAYELQALLAL